MKYCIKPLTSKHNVETRKLLEIYLEEDPMTIPFNLSDFEKKYYIDAIIKFTIPNEISYGAFLEETGELIGCCFNASEQCRLELEDDQLFQNLKTMDRFLDEIEIHLNNLLPNGNYLLLEIGIVKPEYQGKHIVTKLMETSIKMAKERGFDAVTATTTSAKSQHILKKVGLKPMKEILYKEYVDKVTHLKPLYNMEEEKCLLSCMMLKQSKL